MKRKLIVLSILLLGFLLLVLQLMTRPLGPYGLFIKKKFEQLTLKRETTRHFDVITSASLMAEPEKDRITEEN